MSVIAQAYFGYIWHNSLHNQQFLMLSLRDIQNIQRKRTQTKQFWQGISSFNSFWAIFIWKISLIHNVENGMLQDLFSSGTLILMRCIWVQFYITLLNVNIFVHCIYITYTKIYFMRYSSIQGIDAFLKWCFMIIWL